MNKSGKLFTNLLLLVGAIIVSIAAYAPRVLIKDIHTSASLQEIVPIWIVIAIFGAAIFFLGCGEKYNANTSWQAD